MPFRADLGLVAVAAVIAAVVYFYARRRWRTSIERAEEVRRLTWLAAEEASRAEAEAEALAYVAPLVTPSSLTVDDTEVQVGSQCAVCYRRTRTRCSRCKAVRYCSGKCQIFHWRQGHKDNCHPPKIDDGNSGGESVNVSKDLQTNQSDISEDFVKIESKAHHEPLEILSSKPSHDCNSAPVVDNEGHNDVQPSVEIRGADCTPDPADSPPSSSSSSSFSKHLETSDDAASSEDQHVTCFGKLEAASDHSNLPVDLTTVNTGKLNLEIADSSANNMSCQSNIEQKAQSSRADDIKGTSGSNSIGSTNLKKEHSSHVTASSEDNTRSSHKHQTTVGMSNSSSASGRSTETWLSQAKSTRPPSSFSCVDHESSNGKLHAFSRDELTKNDESSLATNLSETTASAPNGISELKTSVKRVVQQLKSSHLSKYSPAIRTDMSQKYKMLFPYDLFVKLYNCDKVEMRPCGLTNCGNSCFANAVLQCLAFTRPLTSYLLQGFHAKTCPKRGWCFTCEFASLLVKAKQGQSPLSPIGILSHIHNIGNNLGHGRQEDAHEFLRYAIDTMQSVCLKEAGINAAGKLAEETTLIHMIFGGYLRSKIKCTRCRGTSERQERMMDLTVEIHGDIGTLEEALARFTATEILDKENKYQCSRCNSYERAKKKLTVLEAPNVLTIALKRFQSGKFGKLNKAVRFPETLDLAPYMSSSSDKSHMYSLYAVVVHQDILNAAFSGHYVCYVKSIQNKWYKTDDSKVKSVDIGKVLANNAYMLFYARCSPRSPSLIEHVNSQSHQKFRSSNSQSHQPISFRTNTMYNQKLPFPRSDSSSDSSSIFSFSDEGSCSTDSNRESTSTEELSEYIFGGYSSSLLSEDSDTCFIATPSVDLEGRESPKFLYSDSRKPTGDNYCRVSREADVLFRRSNATRERRDKTFY